MTVNFGSDKKKTDKKNTKKLGRLLSIDKSYSIIQLISKEPLMMITISKKLAIKLPVLTHYLNKLEEVDLLTIIIKKHPTRNGDSKYYGIKPFTISIP
jgi:predicted transcriptional regulator